MFCVPFIVCWLLVSYLSVTETRNNGHNEVYLLYDFPDPRTSLVQAKPMHTFNARIRIRYEYTEIFNNEA